MYTQYRSIRSIREQSKGCSCCLRNRLKEIRLACCGLSSSSITPVTPNLPMISAFRNRGPKTPGPRFLSLDPLLYISTPSPTLDSVFSSSVPCGSHTTHELRSVRDSYTVSRLRVCSPTPQRAATLCREQMSKGAHECGSVVGGILHVGAPEAPRKAARVLASRLRALPTFQRCRPPAPQSAGCTPTNAFLAERAAAGTSLTVPLKPLFSHFAVRIVTCGKSWRHVGRDHM